MKIVSFLFQVPKQLHGPVIIPTHGFLGEAGLFPDDFEGAGNVRGQNIPQRVEVAAEVIGQEELLESWS